MESESLKKILQDGGSDLLGELPGGTFLLNLAKNIRSAKKTERFNQFVEHAFGSNPKPDNLNNLNNSEAADLLIGVLRRIDQDDNSAKTVIYAEAYRVITNKGLTGEYFFEEFRWDYLDALERLRLSDLATLCMSMVQEKESLGQSEGRIKADTQKQFWDSKLEIWKFDTSVSRLFASGVFSENTKMPTPLASNIVDTLGQIILDTYYDSVKHKPQLNFDSTTGRYSERLVPPAEGWRRSDLGIPE